MSKIRLPGLFALVCLVLSGFGAPASSQPTLDDLVIRAFEISVSITPVPLRYEFSGGELRFLSRGTLRGTATAMVEVTAPTPVASARFAFDSELRLTSVRAAGHQVGSDRQRDRLSLTFTPALPPGGRVAVTFEYEGQPLYIYDEFVLVSEGSLYPVLVSPFGDFSANQARVVLKLTAPGGYNIAGTGKLLSSDGGVLTWDSEVPVPWVAVAGGIGYPAFLLIDDRAFANTFPGDRNRDSSLLQLIAHEVAHSYVPSQTVPKGVGFIWLSEGFAEYLSLMAVDAVLGPDAFKRELQQERDDYAPIAGTTSEPSIASITFTNYRGSARRVIYTKGTLVLHMLRGLLGDDVFKKGLAGYFSTSRGRSARVSDFQDAMEQAAGQKLDGFFRQWIDGRVLPDYTVAQVRSSPTAEGTTQTTAIVRNLGTGQMMVEVGFTTDDGVQIQKVEVPSNGEVTVTATTPRPVKQVEVDPQKWMIQKDYKNDVAPVR